MKISLILTTINRIEEIENFLTHLQAQTYRDFELVLVDQNDDTRLESIIQRFEKEFDIKHLTSSSGASVGRNRGLKEADGEIIGFPDDDCWYPDNCLCDVVDIFKSNKVLDGLIVKMMDKEGIQFSRYPKQCEEITLKNVFNCAATPACFLRKSVVLKVGDFDTHLGPGANTIWLSSDDTDYVIRAIHYGFRIQYNPAVIVFHPNPLEEIRTETLKRAYHYGAGMGKALKKHRFPRYLVFYYLLRPFGGSLLSLVKNEPMRAYYYALNLRGR